MKKFIILLSVISSIAGARQAAKKTVCAITINSNQEIELFKKNFSSQLWDFKELTSFNDQGEKSQGDSDENDGWFKKACQQKIKCDILVVSGHFAGSFFGESDLTLPLETLEKATCDADCSGIINNPKEVFLFGCNTLAGKEKDHRTPEQYLEVLLEDGFSQAQAQQVVAFRYSDLGNSFKGRMSQVFTNTPRIYGFSSVGPSGETIEPFLKKYLQNSKKEYLNFDLYNQTLGTNTNDKFITPLKSMSATQSTGLGILTKQKSERPYCYLANDKVTVKDKLSYINLTLSQGRGLTIINYIKDFLNDLQMKKHSFSVAEKAQLIEIKNNPKIQEDFQKLLTLKGDVYLKTRLDVLGLMKDLQIINSTTYSQLFSKTMDLDLQKLVTIQKRDLLCSLGIQYDFEAKSASQRNFNNEYFLSLLGCFKPQNLSIQHELLKMMKSSADIQHRARVANALSKIKPQNAQIIKSITDLLKNKTDHFLRRDAVNVLKAIQPQDLYIQEMLVELLKSDSNEEVRYQVKLALIKISPKDPQIINSITDIFKNHTNDNARVHAIGILSEINPTDLELQQTLIEIMKNDLSKEIQIATNNALHKIKPQDPQIVNSITDIIKNHTNNNVRISAIAILAEIGTKDKHIQKLLVDNMNNDPDTDVQLSIRYAFQKIIPEDPEIIRALADIIRKHPNPKTRSYAAHIFGHLKSKDAQIIHTITETIKKDPDLQVRAAAMSAILSLKPNDIAIQEMMIGIIKNDDPKFSKDQEIAVRQLYTMAIEDSKIIKMIAEVLSTHKNSEIRHGLSYILSGNELVIKDSVTINLLVKTLKAETNSGVQNNLFIILDNSGSTDPIIAKTLVNSLNNPKDSDALYQTLDAIGNMKTQDATVTQSLIELYKKTKLDDLKCELASAIEIKSIKNEVLSKGIKNYIKSCDEVGDGY